MQRPAGRIGADRAHVAIEADDEELRVVGIVAEVAAEHAGESFGDGIGVIQPRTMRRDGEANGAIGCREIEPGRIRRAGFELFEAAGTKVAHTGDDAGRGARPHVGGVELASGCAELDATATGAAVADAERVELALDEHF